MLYQIVTIDLYRIGSVFIVYDGWARLNTAINITTMSHATLIAKVWAVQLQHCIVHTINFYEHALVKHQSWMSFSSLDTTTLEIHSVACC
jgi:hypothetical protein